MSSLSSSVALIVAQLPGGLGCDDEFAVWSGRLGGLLLTQKHSHNASGLVELFWVIGVRFVGQDELGNGHCRSCVLCAASERLPSDLKLSGGIAVPRQLGACGGMAIGVLGGRSDRFDRFVGLELGESPFFAQELKGVVQNRGLGSGYHLEIWNAPIERKPCVIVKRKSDMISFLQFLVAKAGLVVWEKFKDKRWSGRGIYITRAKV